MSEGKAFRRPTNGYGRLPATATIVEMKWIVVECFPGVSVSRCQNPGDWGDQVFARSGGEKPPKHAREEAKGGEVRGMGVRELPRIFC